MNILIPTMPDDPHAIYVQLALESLGHECCLLFTADLPSLQRHVFELQKGEVIWTASGTDLEVCKNTSFDVVWYRRPRQPVLPDIIHPDDEKVASRENRALFHTIWNVIASNARWVNPPKCAIAANCKLLQLKMASKIGLNVPATIISNDPIKIKEFIKNNKAEKVIYKPLMPPVWIKDDKIKLTYTDTIELDDLPLDSVLQLTPGIFQKKIPKAFELRVTFMGGFCIAVKINSQIHPKGIMDWRYVPPQELSIEKFELPFDIIEKCIALMKSLDLVFGCLDFIVTPSGEYYFLEINEQGQFLWVEDLCPDIKMLNSFVNFLINPITGSAQNVSSYNISMTDFTEEVLRRRTRAMEGHINPVDL